VGFLLNRSRLTRLFSFSRDIATATLCVFALIFNFSNVPIFAKLAGFRNGPKISLSVVRFGRFRDMLASMGSCRQRPKENGQKKKRPKDFKNKTNPQKRPKEKRRKKRKNRTKKPDEKSPQDARKNAGGR
jgi:hypothetical protein